MYVRSNNPKQRGDLIIRRDGSTTELRISGTTNSPAWSPDGKSVAWLEKADGVDHVWVAEVITDRAGEPELENPRELDFSAVPGPPGWGSR